MKFDHPIRILSRRDRLLWGFSVLVIAGSAICCRSADPLSVTASLIGVTGLIYMAKGHPYGQLITIFFSVLYGIISYFSRYYGEMLTYLGMTLPMAALSLVTWMRNPYGDSATVTVRQTLSRRLLFRMLTLTAAVTALFGWMLALLHTACLPVSILSVTTSFLAAFLTAARSPYYALAYAANDIVLVILWIAAREIPMTACFLMFLINDLYAFVNWKRRAAAQHSDSLQET